MKDVENAQQMILSIEKELSNIKENIELFIEIDG